MTPVVDLWDSVFGTLSTSAGVTLLLVVIGGVAALATIGSVGFHYLRRRIRHRRVARELARVHAAAYRERVGQRGRLA